MLWPFKLNPIAKILTFVGLSSLFLLFPFLVIRGREMISIEAEAIAQDNAAFLTDLDLARLEKAQEHNFYL